MNKTDLGKNCLISISVILLYFFWPTVLKAFWETFGGGTSVTLGMFIYNVVGYAILVGILVAIYYKPLKENWIKFCKDKKKIVSILKYTAILFIGVLICNSILKYVFDVGVIENEADLLVQFEKSPIWILLMVTIYYPIESARRSASHRRLPLKSSLRPPQACSTGKSAPFRSRRSKAPCPPWLPTRSCWVIIRGSCP